MNLKIVNSRENGVIMCPFCYGCGYIYNPDHRVCPSCKGFGLIKWETKRDTDIASDDDQLARVTQV